MAMGIWLPGGSAVSSDDCTLVKANVPRGMTAVTADSDDEAVEGTLNVDTNLVAGQALEGKTFLLWDKETKLFKKEIGSLPYRGNVQYQLPINGSFHIDWGLHGGEGRVYQNVPTKGAQSYTPGRWNQTIPAGQWLAGDQIIYGDTNFIPSNIKKGVSMWGVYGTFEGMATSPYYLWRRGTFQNGQSATLGNHGSITGDSIRVGKADSGAYFNDFVNPSGYRFLKAVVSPTSEVSGNNNRQIVMSLRNASNGVIATISSHVLVSMYEVTLAIDVSGINYPCRVHMDGVKTVSGTQFNSGADFKEVFFSQE